MIWEWGKGRGKYFNILMPNRDRVIYGGTSNSKPNSKPNLPNLGISENSSSKHSVGSVFCCESTNDLDIQHGNSRFWNEIYGNLPTKIWSSIKQLDVEGEEEDEVHEVIIRGLEARDRKSRKSGVENQPGVP